MTLPVYVVDDDPAIRNSLRFLLSNSGRDVRTFDSGEALLAEVDDLPPGPILLDVMMNGLTGLQVQARLAERGTFLPLIILTGFGNLAMAVKAMKAGAADFLPKPCERGELLAALDQADLKLSNQQAQADLREQATRKLRTLSLRELQIFSELARGFPNKTVAYDLGISPRTVEVHRSRIMHKLRARSFPQALRLAFCAGMPFAADWWESIETVEQATKKMRSNMQGHGWKPGRARTSSINRRAQSMEKWMMNSLASREVLKHSASKPG